jgi:hypothetical protein
VDHTTGTESTLIQVTISEVRQAFLTLSAVPNDVTFEKPQLNSEGTSSGAGIRDNDRSNDRLSVPAVHPCEALGFVTIGLNVGTSFGLAGRDPA